MTKTQFYRYAGVGFFVVGILRASTDETRSILLGGIGFFLWAIGDLITEIRKSGRGS